MTIARREAIEGYIAISPWILGFIMFTGGPIIASIVISLTEWNLIEPPIFVGIANYVGMLNDPLVWKALQVTSYYTFTAVPLGIIFGFLLAILLNQKITLLAVWRTIFYLPAVVSGVAVATVWIWVLQPDFGVLNSLLREIGIEGPNWLFSQVWVIPSLVVMSLWGVGGGLIIYLSGLQGIPTEMFEAAQIDGANAVQRMFSITIPMMTPILFMQLVTGLIGSFQVFTSAYIMTGGGPGNASLFYVLYIYRNAFQYFQMGYASALSWILTLVIIAITLFVFWSARFWVYYDVDVKDL